MNICPWFLAIWKTPDVSTSYYLLLYFYFREAAELEAEVKKRLRYVGLGIYAVIVL
jgi:hypothetical protein